MPRLCLLPFLAALAVLGRGQDAGRESEVYDVSLRPLVTAYCGRCHSGDKPKADLDLLAARTRAEVIEAGADFARASRRLRDGVMPPQSAAQPTPDERARLAGGIEAILRDAGVAAGTTGSRVVMRRLTRFEFDRVVADLLGVAYDSTRSFPAEAPSGGFDGIGDVMTMSPLLLEKHFDAASQIAAKALADPGARARLLLPCGTGARLDAAAARAVLEPLMDRAFRRPATTEEVEARVALFQETADRTGSADAGLEAALRSILLAPAFLFRVEAGEEQAEGQASRALSDFELAARLSLFLWSTIPDAELTALAREGRLREPPVLAAETRRLLASPRSRALADGFAAQWLRFREVLTQSADYRRFPKIWNERLRPAMAEECARFFDAIVKEDRNVLQLLDARTTFVDATLAEHYGLPAVPAGEWREVALPDRSRGGVLGMAAVLMVTSHPLRTSPTLRGTWILDVLLGDPPPPPPADAGSLPKDDQQPDGFTLRQRLERHRKDPACTACHARIDPLGFALENYDALGVWRAERDERLIDTRAELPDGTLVDGPGALKDALLSRRRDFLGNLARRLLAYAVGRPAGAADGPLVAALVDDLERGGHRWSVLVLGLVQSEAFRTLTMESPDR